MALSYSAATTITISPESIAVDAWRESTVVDNTTNLYLDAQLGGSIQVGAVTVGGIIGVYLYSLAVDSSTYTSSLSGSDATVVWGTTPSASSAEGFNQLEQIHGLVVGAADNKDIVWGVKSVADLFGGVLPLKWGVVYHNDTDIAFHATGTNNEVNYWGLKLT